MQNIMIIIGIIKIGSVDYINNGYAGIEYMVGENIHYVDISLSESKCKPEEGGLVFFDNSKIIKCFQKT